MIWRDDPLAIPISTTSSSSKGVRTLRVEVETKEHWPLLTSSRTTRGRGGCQCKELEDSWGDQQGCLQEQLLGCINQVPTTEEQGAVQGELVNHLLGWRDEIEGQLMELSRVAKAQQIRLCALQAQGQQGGEGEQVLQAMTVPLSEVRENADAWRPSFQYEYDVLVKETEAVVPTKRHLLAPGTELVLGKMVCCKKGGTGAKRSRAVICGNLASEQADPPPGGLPGGSYASGADGVLIRASLLEASQRRWEITSLDVKSAFLQAPGPHQPGGKPVHGSSAAERDGGPGSL